MELASRWSTITHMNRHICQLWLTDYTIHMSNLSLSLPSQWQKGINIKLAFWQSRGNLYFTSVTSLASLSVKSCCLLLYFQISVSGYNVTVTQRPHSCCYYTQPHCSKVTLDWSMVYSSTTNTKEGAESTWSHLLC